MTLCIASAHTPHVGVQMNEYPEPMTCAIVTFIFHSFPLHIVYLPTSVRFNLYFVCSPTITLTPITYYIHARLYYSPLNSAYIAYTRHYASTKISLLCQNNSIVKSIRYNSLTLPDFMQPSLFAHSLIQIFNIFFLLFIHLHVVWRSYSSKLHLLVKLLKLYKLFYLINLE